jgi:hypothetical protein
MCDSGLVRGLCSRTLYIRVNPLVVVSQVGEFADPLLCDIQVVGHCNLGLGVMQQFADVRNGQGFHSQS